MAAIRTFRAYLEAISPPWLAGKVGSYFVGTAIGLMEDIIGDAALYAYKAPLIGRRDSPDDALYYAGKSRNIEQYPGETAARYRARLLGAWTAWVEAGTKAGLLSQLSKFGYPGAVIYEDKDWERQPKPWWSQFWIFLPEGTHSFTAPPICGDGSVCGSGVQCGITGDQAVLRGLRRIANKWRPAHVLCREYVVEVAGPTCGTGPVCGDGSTAGGSIAYLTL